MWITNLEVRLKDNEKQAQKALESRNSSNEILL